MFKVKGKMGAIFSYPDHELNQTDPDKLLEHNKAMLKILEERRQILTNSGSVSGGASGARAPLDFSKGTTSTILTEPFWHHH